MIGANLGDGLLAGFAVRVVDRAGQGVRRRSTEQWQRLTRADRRYRPAVEGAVGLFWAGVPTGDTAFSRPSVPRRVDFSTWVADVDRR